jgi:hypothetical protein
VLQAKFASETFWQKDQPYDDQQRQRSVPKALSGYHNCNITKKSVLKKLNKKLISLPFSFRPSAAVTAKTPVYRLGQVRRQQDGTMALVLELPEGRIKLVGAVTFPDGRLLTLEFRKGGARTGKAAVNTLTSRHSFDSVLVFSQMSWIGTAEDNEEEKPLEWPVEVRSALDVDESEVEVLTRTPAADTPAKSGSGLPSRKRKWDSDMEDSSEDSDEGPLSPSQPIKRARRSSVKKVSYADSSSDDRGSGEDSDAEEGESEESEESEESGSSSSSSAYSERKRGKKGKVKRGKQPTSAKKKKNVVIELSSDSDFAA